MKQLEASIVDCDAEAAVKAAEAIVEGGGNVMEAIDGAAAAIRRVGDSFQCGDIYLPELMRAGEAMKQCMGVLAPRVRAQGGVKLKGKVIVGAVSGDIHDIGKNLVATMLSVNGFDVVDLGVDVQPMKFVDTALQEKAQFIALSALMTTSMPYQKDVLNCLREMGLRDKFYVVVGGGPVTLDYARGMGADGWGMTAIAAVRVCERLAEGSQPAPVSDVVIEN
jgi:trimethylamine corrinoid protein